MKTTSRKMIGAELVKLITPESERIVFSTDERPGIRRRRIGSGFIYFDAKGRRLRRSEEIRRIKSLAIPPAWTDVWICPRSNGHLQATGRDARGRKQYRYHPAWRAARDQNKYDRLREVVSVLPRIRRRVRRDLKQQGLIRDRVLATVVRALETTLIRVGNEEYARTNGSFGLTTLRNGHAVVRGCTIRFSFRGKSGKHHVVECSDAQLARIVKRCQELPGRELFGYLDDDGKVCDVNSTDVNQYLREAAGTEITAKDFRTWAGTLFAATELVKLASAASRPTKASVAKVVEVVAEQLGNTKAVCRKCYIHPAVVEAYLDRSLLPYFQRTGTRKSGLKAAEASLLRLLKAYARSHRGQCKPCGT